MIEEQRQITIRYANSTHEDEAGNEVTDPIRKRPASMTRRQWRELTRKGYRMVRKQQLVQRRAEAAMPEAEKIDRRLHSAGLYSSRDIGCVRPVEFTFEGA